MTKKRKIKTPGVYQDSNGTYYLKYKNKTYRGFNSVEEASVHKAKLTLSQDTPKSLKLSDIILDYESTESNRVATEEITYATKLSRVNTINKYIKPVLGDVKLTKFTPLKLRNFRNSFISSPLSTTTKNYILASLKQLFLHARKYFDLQEDLSVFLDNFPATKSEQENRKERFSNIWTSSEFEEFNKHVQDEKMRLIFMLFFYHGLRLGEALALQWYCIDFEDKTITIDGSMTKKTQSGRAEKKSTKTTSSDRTIHIGVNRINMFKEIFEKDKVTHGFNDKTFIFGFERPISANTVSRARKSALELSKVTYANNHDMRHMFVTNAWGKAPLSALSKYIGHKNVGVTLDKYSHLAKDDFNTFNDYIDNFND